MSVLKRCPVKTELTNTTLFLCSFVSLLEKQRKEKVTRFGVGALILTKVMGLDRRKIFEESP